jgi:hypothetical protein
MAPDCSEAAAATGSGDATMTWNLFSIITASDDDASIFPVLSEPGTDYPVELEPRDGPSHLHSRAKYVHLRQRNNKEFRLDQLGRGGSGLVDVVKLPADIDFEMLVTDARLVLYCQKYNKGGGWIGGGLGGAAIAVAANAVSQARAAHRRKGSLLAGHVRYPWVHTIRATPKVDWRTTGYVLISMNTGAVGSDRYIMLQLSVPKDVSALNFAHDLAQRVARYRLAHDNDMSAEAKVAFEAIADGPRREPSTPSTFKNNTWVEYVMPTSYRVNSATAFPQKAEDSK